MNLGNKILQNIFKHKEVISASIVGSYTEKKNLNKIGDIDVVVICKKLTKNLIKKLIKDVNKINNYNFKKNSCKLFFWSVKNFLRRIFASSFDDL